MIGAEAVSTSCPWMFSAPCRESVLGLAGRGGGGGGGRLRRGPRAGGGLRRLQRCCGLLLLLRDRRLLCQRGLHLHELRHVGVAQHQADVGMRDQPPLRAHDIGVAVLADLDLGDHVPDQLQIDLGDADAGVLAGAGQRQRHIGLGLPAEIDRAVIDLVGDGLGEFRVLGEIEAAVDDVHGEARDPQPLLAGRVDLGELGDGRHLPQQPQRVEPAVLQRARRPGQLRGPAELALDFLDELADLGRRRLGLLVLDADQRGLVLAVVEEDLENAVR